MTKAGTDNYGYFEDMYSSEEEPWRYSVRAVEVLRHERILELVQEMAPRRVLEIGCSLGLLTEKVVDVQHSFTALDLSPTAVQRARGRLRERGAAPPGWMVGSVLDLPIRARSFDLVLASDGPVSWCLSTPERARALEQIHEVLAPGGHAIITEYLRHRRFDGFIAEISASPLHVASVSYLYNRPWYQMERSLRPAARTRAVGAILSSVAMARSLSAVARIFGRHAAHHIIVVARRA